MISLVRFDMRNNQTFLGYVGWVLTQSRTVEVHFRDLDSISHDMIPRTRTRLAFTIRMSLSVGQHPRVKRLRPDP